MKKPKIYRFEVTGKNYLLQTKRFVKYSEYERLRAKYKELLGKYHTLQGALFKRIKR